MEFEIFCENVINELHQIYDGAKIEIHKIYKNNGVCLQGLTILEKGKAMAPNIYLDAYYQQFMSGSVSIGQIVYEIASQHDEIKVDMPEDIKWTWENVKEKIFCKIINKGANKERLANAPHRDYLDLAVTVRVLHQMGKDGISSTEVDYKTLQLLGITEEDLFEQAIQNTERLFSLERQSLLDVVARHLDEEDKLKELAMDGNEPMPMYILTNTQGINGATAMLYKNVLKDMADDLGVDGFYIMPSSIHESIIMCGDADVRFLKELVVEANRSAVSRVEWLSDSVYKYDREEDKVEIVA